MSYKAEMHTAPEEWTTNALRFETVEEADSYGFDLIMRWTVPDDFRVAESDEPVNYQWTDKGLERIVED